MWGIYIYIFISYQGEVNLRKLMAGYPHDGGLVGFIFNFQIVGYTSSSSLRSTLNQFTPHDLDPFQPQAYCWWKKSCTTLRCIKTFLNNRIDYISTGAGFLPSTVSLELGNVRRNFLNLHWKKTIIPGFHTTWQWAFKIFPWSTMLNLQKTLATVLGNTILQFPFGPLPPFFRGF